VLSPPTVKISAFFQETLEEIFKIPNQGFCLVAGLQSAKV